jgi:hypothetical protein
MIYTSIYPPYLVAGRPGDETAMADWAYREKDGLGRSQPHYYADLGSGVAAVVGFDPETRGNIVWHLVGPGGMFLEQGTANNLEAAQRAAEDAAKPYTSKRGRRAASFITPMSNTDRNKHRIARLMAKATAADEATQWLVTLHRDLVADGQQEWAGRVATILRRAALIAVADYTRRNSDFFVTHGPRLPTPDERAERKQRILSLADKVRELAAIIDGPVRYVQFEEVLTDLHKAGFFPENSLVSAVAQGFFLAA